MRLLRSLTQDYLNGKVCLLRVNLDVKNLEKNNRRIKAAVPTIKFLLENGAKILLLSHRGRPGGKRDDKLSLEPAVKILSEKVGQPFDSAQGNQLCWLENLRFLPWEEKNDEQFAKELAAKGDFYVNDDFATSHRRHASIVALAEQLPSFAGFLLEKEVEVLSKVRDNPEHPLVVIIGGIKIEDKVAVIENLKNQANHFLMGSAYQDIKNKKVILPMDRVDGFDIGIKTIELYQKIIASAKTVIWNGPLGRFEDKRYVNGSKAIAQAIADSQAFSVVGGGDTCQLLVQLEMEDKFDFISTGGGAMLEFLAGRSLPGIEVLED